MILRRLSIILSSAVAVAACSPHNSNFTAPIDVEMCESLTEAQGIINGDIVTKSTQITNSTVLIVQVNSKDEQSVCTGTLIDDNKVLTAAHCAPPDTSAIYIAFTKNSQCIGADPINTLRVVDKVLTHPDYDFTSKSLSNASQDIAVMKFSGPKALGYTVEELPLKDLKVSDSDNLTMLGFGDTIENARDAGTLRMTSASATRLQKSFHVALTKTDFEIPKTFALLQDKNGVCGGDSGGPLFVNNPDGKPLLVGITSMGVDHRTTSISKTRVCHGISLFTDLRPHLEWIQLQMLQLK